MTTPIKVLNMNANAKTASIGLRAKTGRAIAVVLVGPVNSPQALKRAELILTDPHVPATGQPYHEVMDLPWEQAQAAVRKTAAAIEAVAAKALAALVQEVEAAGLTVRSVGIVGAADRDLTKIGGPHIRAHAAEGVLFRQVLEVAAAANGLASRTLAERGLEELAAAELKLSSAKLSKQIADFGRAVGRPWRADEKAAAMAAWLAEACAN